MRPPTPSPWPWRASDQEAEQRLNRYRPGLQGTIVERIFYSPALGREMPYDIYLPPGYDASDRRYPVLYMLHGGGGHRDEWLGYLMLESADPAIRAGRMQPMIIVFPQGNGGYWTDNANGGPRWAQYVWRDVVGHIDASYRTLPRPASRAIGGNSMGGWGALAITFLHPDVFSVAAGHSPSLPEDDGTRPMLGTGEEYRRNNPIDLASTAPGLQALHIWIDVGQDDTWLPRVTVLHEALAARGLTHTWQVEPGDHDFTYWMRRLPDYLRFYSEHLAGQ